MPKKIITVCLCAALCVPIVSMHIFKNTSYAMSDFRSLNIPDLRGYSYAKCKHYYADYFNLQGHYEYSTEAADGIIISQDPEPDKTYLEGSCPTVKCIISKGPRMVTVPDTVGIDRETAEAIFMGSGLETMAVNYKYSEEYPKGTVISTIPAPTKRLMYGDTVKLIISKGKAPEENLQGDD